MYSKGLGFHASLNAADVLVVKGSHEYAYLRINDTIVASERIAGTIIDGLTRDSYYTQGVDYPIFKVIHLLI